MRECCSGAKDCNRCKAEPEFRVAVSSRRNCVVEGYVASDYRAKHVLKQKAEVAQKQRAVGEKLAKAEIDKVAEAQKEV